MLLATALCSMIALPRHVILVSAAVSILLTLHYVMIVNLELLDLVKMLLVSVLASGPDQQHAPQTFGGVTQPRTLLQ